MNFEMSVNEHVMMSSDQRSSLCHPANLLNDGHWTARAIHTEKSASYKKIAGAWIKFHEISSISRSCRHPDSSTEQVISQLRRITCHGITQCYLPLDTSERIPP